jgi:uncharacterized membrane protein
MAHDVSKSRTGDIIRSGARVALGGGLVLAGYTHLTSQRKEFQAQVPNWLPLNKDTVVLASGVAEITLGAALLLLPGKKQTVGRIAAAFFTAIFPGNISQFTTRTDAFGLDTDGKRLARLPFQLVLIAWALWSTGAGRKAS